MQYRREIDGLRAVAVLPVILFHAGLNVFSGGFVGVDVFFVISGYLITTILIAEREAGTYSLLGFYERRARRILPALFLVLIVTIPFAWAWIPPEPFEDFSRSLAFASLFISNVHFLEFGGYFDLDAELRPLLHTWSLAVEEQYYLIFPLVLMGLGRFGKRKYLLIFMVLALASLAIAEWGWRNHPNENFYFTPSRFWELLAGSICAVLLFQRGQMKNEVLAGLGLAMILGATVFFNAAIPSPSVFMLVPVVGTVLIILFAEKDTLTARLLSLKPFVAIGLISYSAYLWHQPVFALARLRSSVEVPPVIMMALAGLALVLAYLSWRFVEQPVRGKRAVVLPTRAGILTVSLIGIIAFAAFGGFGVQKAGFPERLEAGRTPFLTSLEEQAQQSTAGGVCFEAAIDGAGLCPAYGDPNAATRVVVIGDSHSLALLPSFEGAADALDAQIVYDGYGACPPLLGVYKAGSGADGRLCHDLMQTIADQVVDEKLDAVALVARWSIYSTGTYDGPFVKSRISEKPDQTFVSLEEWHQAFENGLRRTLAHYTEGGVKVLLVHQVPQQKVQPALVVQNAMLLGLDDEAAKTRFRSSFLHREDNDALQSRMRGVMERVASEYGAEVLSLDEALADGDQFMWVKGDDLLYWDDDHVTKTAKKYLAEPITEALRDLLAR